MGTLWKSNICYSYSCRRKRTRLKSKRAKVLHSIAGKPLLQHVLDAVLKVTSPDQVFVVVGHQAEQVERAGCHRGAFCAANAAIGHGTCGAMPGRLCLRYGRPAGTFRRCPADSAGNHRAFTEFSPDAKGCHDDSNHSARKSVWIWASGSSEPTSPDVGAIIEQKALTDEQQHIGEINSGIYVFHIDTLYRHIDALQSNNAHGEYYLTDMAAILRAAGEARGGV